MYCLGCCKGISELEDMGYADGCPECGYPAIPVSEAIPIAMQLLEFAGWQPMETAPMDGTLILAQRDRGDPVTAFYDDTPGTDRWCLATGERMGWTELTGWLPLPPTTK